MTQLPENLTFDTGRGHFLSDWDVADVKDAINGLITYLQEREKTYTTVSDRLPSGYSEAPKLSVPDENEPL